MNGRDRDGVSEAQVVEFVEVGREFARGVALIDAEDDGLSALLEHGGHLEVCCDHAVPDVRDEDDDFGAVDGQLGLTAHLGQDDVIGMGLDAAGVHQQHGVAQPLTVPVDAVPGDAGRVVHDGEALTDEFVEQGGLAHVRPAHNGHDRFCHVHTPPFLIKKRRKGGEVRLLHLGPSQSNVAERSVFVDDLSAVVVATLEAYSVRSFVRAALRASDEFRCVHLPDVGTSLVSSGLGRFSCRYCHGTVTSLIQ